MVGSEKGSGWLDDVTGALTSVSGVIDSADNFTLPTVTTESSFKLEPKTIGMIALLGIGLIGLFKFWK